MIHEILSNVYMQDAGLQTMAISRGEGFLHIIGEQRGAAMWKYSNQETESESFYLSVVIDERNPPALHRAGEPEDIIASVLCKDGKLVDGHYEEGYTYRQVCSLLFKCIPTDTGALQPGHCQRAHQAQR